MRICTSVKVITSNPWCMITIKFYIRTFCAFISSQCYVFESWNPKCCISSPLSLCSLMKCILLSLSILIHLYWYPLCIGRFFLLMVVFVFVCWCIKWIIYKYVGVGGIEWFMVGSGHNISVPKCAPYPLSWVFTINDGVCFGNWTNISWQWIW